MELEGHAFFHALSDPTRLRCLALLHAHGELCVCELTAALDEAQPKVSRHLALLREMGLVLARREGVWMHYHLNPALPAWAREVLDVALPALAPAGVGQGDSAAWRTNEGEGHAVCLADGPTPAAPKSGDGE